MIPALDFDLSDRLTTETGAARPLRPVAVGDPICDTPWAEAVGFEGRPGQLMPVSDERGGIAEVRFGAGAGVQPDHVRAVAARLPAGDWFAPDLPEAMRALAAVAFLEGLYRFDRYRTDRASRQVRWVVSPEIKDRVLATAQATTLARALVDTPARDMGPAELEAVARAIADQPGATVAVTRGEALDDRGYRMIRAVGAAASVDREPRLIEIGWRMDQADRPLVALVGKGVVFDTGGLDVKPAAGMRNMKKDMGGAAHVLALARLIMEADLPIRLVVLVGAVENAISAEALRPGDVLTSRAGLTVEIGNTDAEGRLVLADCLHRAGEHVPDLTLDFATLTGAARVALGPDLPALYSRDDGLARELIEAGRDHGDPLWHMPLWDGYAPAVGAEIADLRNDSAAWAQAGSVTAALFLSRFAPRSGHWAHLDIFAWNPRGRPGWPEGGAAQGLKAAFGLLESRYGAGFAGGR